MPYLNDLKFYATDKAMAHRLTYVKRGGKLFKKLAPTADEILAKLLDDRRSLHKTCEEAVKLHNGSRAVSEDLIGYLRVGEFIRDLIGPDGVPKVSFERATDAEIAAYAKAEEKLKAAATAFHDKRKARQKAAGKARMVREINQAEKLLAKHGRIVLS